MWFGKTTGAETRRRVPVFCSLLVLAVGLAACGGTQGGAPEEEIALEVTLDPSTPVVGPSRATLILTQDSGEPLAGAEVSVEGNMNHAGMVPVFADAVETAPGHYEAQLEFTMGGDWFLLVQAKMPDGRSFDWKEDIPGVRRN